MISRRAMLMALGAGALTAPLPTFGQQARVYRIGYLANDPDRASPTFQAFAAALRELGWSEGTNIEILYLTSAGRDELFTEFAAESVRENVDVIVTTGSASTRAAMIATATIPIVFGSAANPVEQKFVASLARPGGNVTGLALLVQELAQKRLQLLKQILPRATRFGRLYQASNIVVMQPAIAKEYDAAAQKLGVAVQHIPVTDLQDIETAFAAAARNDIVAMTLLADALFVVNRGWLAKRALAYRLPMLCPDARFVEAGALASYGENFASRYRRAAFLVDKILRGAKPADIPVEQPEIFELAINLTTAKALGVQLPDPVLLQAERVIR
jgi:putative tryptophan/tyrosine transport system substrate-binding protein